MTVAGYHASGGIRDAVAQSAELVYEKATPRQRPLLRDLMLRLVTPSPEGEPVRSRVPRRVVATDPDHEQVIELLVGARLVTSDEEMRRAGSRGAGPRLATAARLARRRRRGPAHPASPCCFRRHVGRDGTARR